MNYHPTYPSTRNPAEDQARPVPQYLSSGVMYQLFLRMFTAAGTFKAAEAMIPHLSSLGVNVVYICPFTLADDDPDEKFWSNRQRLSGLKNPANPYRLKDYFAIDPEYGTAEEARSLIAACHKAGMKVLLDVVYFHCGPTATLLEEHPDFVCRDEKGDFKLGEWCFPEMDLSKPAVREFFYENMLFLMREYHADGFRCDVGDKLPVDFWEEAHRRITAVNPEAIMLCEGLRGDDQHLAFDLSYGFYTQWAIRSILLGEANATKVRRAQEKELVDYPRGFHWMRCFDNHDFSMDATMSSGRFESCADGRLCDSMLALLFMLNGIPMLYNGQEVADASPHSIFSNREHGRYAVDWSGALTERGQKRMALVRRLTAMRHDHPQLFDAPLQWQDTPTPEATMFFLRPVENCTLAMAINTTPQPQEVPLANLANAQLFIQAEGASLQGDILTLPPYGFAIMKA